MLVRGQSFNILNPELFEHGLEAIRRSVATPDAFYASDNVITWNRNLSFMRDERLMDSFRRHATTDIEVSIIWRTYVLAWFARQAMRLPGDFVEVGAYKGNTAHILMEQTGFSGSGRSYWLYDTFEHREGDLNHAMPEHGPDLHDRVRARFAGHPEVRIVRGYVPESFDDGFPERIAFAHVDLNQAPAECAALRRILPAMTPGGVIVLDDYGWWAYRAQKEAEDPLLAEFGLEALELPTGQGLVIAA